MERTLTVMRHAKSSWGTGDLDIERPLSRRGRKDAGAAGRWMTDHGYAYDLVYCSPATRTRRTWAEMSGAGVQAGRVEFVDGIYHGYADFLFELVQAAPADVQRLLIIGHQPTVEMFCVTATGADPSGDGDLPMGFTTGAFAVLGIDGDWDTFAPGSARALASHSPRG